MTYWDKAEQAHMSGAWTDQEFDAFVERAGKHRINGASEQRADASAWFDTVADVMQRRADEQENI